jgi:hypothetical protein
VSPTLCVPKSFSSKLLSCSQAEQKLRDLKDTLDSDESHQSTALKQIQVAIPEADTAIWNRYMSFKAASFAEKHAMAELEFQQQKTRLAKFRLLSYRINGNYDAAITVQEHNAIMELVEECAKAETNAQRNHERALADQAGQNCLFNLLSQRCPSEQTLLESLALHPLLADKTKRWTAWEAQVDALAEAV